MSGSAWRGTSEELDFLAEGGEIAARLRAYDWTKSPLGPPAQWPESLKTALQLILRSRQSMTIWWGPELVQFYNEACRDAIGPERHPAALGARAAETWSEYWDVLGADIEQVMTGRGAVWRENHRGTMVRYGHTEEVSWTYSMTPIVDSASPGGIGGVLAIGYETTRVIAALRASEEQSESLRERELRYRHLFNAIDQGFCVIEMIYDAAGKPVDYRFLEVNAAFERQTGLKHAVGKTMRALVPRHEEHWFEVYGRIAETGRAERFELPAAELGYYYEVYAFRVGLPSARSVAIFFQDISARKQAEARTTEMSDRLHVLVAELQHRTRNLLAVVRAIADRTVVNSSGLADFSERFGERLAALARVNSLLSRLEGTHKVAFDELVLAELSALGITDGRDTNPRVSLDGPPGVRLRSTTVQSLALALHELATNAMKHGALKHNGGHLCIRWWTTRTPAGENVLEVEWEESGLPPLPADAALPSRGFGRELIEKMLPYQFNAKTTYELGPEGVRCRISLPIAEQRSGADDA